MIIYKAMLFLYFVALMIVSLIERKIRINMAVEKIDKLPILPQAMNSKKPTWNNIRYCFQNVHYSEIIRNGLWMVIGYGILKYLSPEAAGAQMPGPQPRILFNYLGSFDDGARGRLRIDERTPANTVGGGFERESEIVIEGAVIGRRLKLDLSYHPKIHARETVDAFLQAYRDALLCLIDHCLACDAEAPTPHEPRKGHCWTMRWCSRTTRWTTNCTSEHVRLSHTPASPYPSCSIRRIRRR
jgi:non-ribosomal peptide synthase protein (TIGR01720 family)